MQQAVIPCDLSFFLSLCLYTPTTLARNIANSFNFVVKLGLTTAQQRSLAKMLLRNNTAYGDAQTNLTNKHRALPPPRHRSANKSPDMRYVRAGRIVKGKLVQKPISFPDPEGFHNPHSWCYRRSLLQCLLHTPAFCRFLLRPHQGCNAQSVRDCVFCALRLLANTYWNDKQNFNTGGALALLDAAIERRWSQENDVTLKDLRNRKRQSDPHEFLAKLMELLQGTEAERMRIKKLLGVKYEVRYLCPDCDTTRTREDTELGLGLSLDDPLNGKLLTEYLRQHFRRGELEGFSCQSAHCRALNKAAPPNQQEERDIIEAPQVQVIQLVRMKTSFVGGHLQESKIGERVSYDDRLELEDFSKKKVRLSYQLTGVVAHNGANLKAGHYVAAVRRRGRDGFSVISDSEVGQSGGFAEMADPMFDGRRFDAYLLVYSRLR